MKASLTFAGSLPPLVASAQVVAVMGYAPFTGLLTTCTSRSSGMVETSPALLTASMVGATNAPSSPMAAAVSAIPALRASPRST